MSTKISETCPECGEEVNPTDTAQMIWVGSLKVDVRFWRYECPTCQWIWANELQRTHNNHTYHRACNLVTEHLNSYMC